MEGDRYCYSTDGTDAHGPVPHDEFCQLIRDKVIGSDSFFCLEGETEWRPLDPDLFVRPPGTTRLPPYEPPPYVPQPDAKARDEERLEQLQQAWEDDGPYPIALLWICWLLRIGSSITLYTLTGGANGYFGLAGILAVFAFIPYVITLPFRRPWRIRIRLVAIIIFATLTIIGQLKINSDAVAAAASAQPAATPDPGK
jgi:hypothetical protein